MRQRGIRERGITPSRACGPEKHDVDVDDLRDISKNFEFYSFAAFHNVLSETC